MIDASICANSEEMIDIFSHMIFNISNDESVFNEFVRFRFCEIYDDIKWTLLLLHNNDCDST